MEYCNTSTSFTLSSCISMYYANFHVEFTIILLLLHHHLYSYVYGCVCAGISGVSGEVEEHSRIEWMLLNYTYFKGNRMKSTFVVVAFPSFLYFFCSFCEFYRRKRNFFFLSSVYANSFIYS